MVSFSITIGDERNSILKILEHNYSYFEIEQKIIEHNREIDDVIILNQNDHICFFIVYYDNITIVSPYVSIKDNRTIKKLKTYEKLRNCSFYVCSGVDINDISEVINTPRFLLINYCNNDKFTVPRLNLSTHTLASYLREKSFARVYIVDMQFFSREIEVLKILETMKPHALGISINYGLFDSSIAFINNIYALMRKHELNISIILGNIIPAVNYNEYLEKHPDIIVSYSEGENAILDFWNYVIGKKKKEEISGVYYFDKVKNSIIKNDLILIDMDDLPFPALDTLINLKNRRGALSIEFSRGCPHSVCTFCPRNHKGKSWRYMNSSKMFAMSKRLFDICKLEEIYPRIYVADEEFVGFINGQDEVERLSHFFNMLASSNINITFDISCRVDSVYSPTLDDSINIERIKMWRLGAKICLGRVFLGVESFCDSQLKRYNKGTTCKQNLYAIKLLTALGIDIRLGILLFDQLMVSVNEIKENIDILGSDKIIQHQFNEDISCEIIYNEIIKQISNNNQHGIPLYMKTSYLLTTMEILKCSPYFDLCNKLKLIISENINYGSYNAFFINEYVGIISLFFKDWVTINYPIIYATKTYIKTCAHDEFPVLEQILNYYKFLNFELLRYVLFYTYDSGLSNNNISSFSSFIDENLNDIGDYLFYDDVNLFLEVTLQSAMRYFLNKLEELQGQLDKESIVGKKIFHLIGKYKRIMKEKSE